VKHAFYLNDRLTRYDSVTEYRSHEIALYSYYSNGRPKTWAFIDNDTLGYYDTKEHAFYRAKQVVDRICERKEKGIAEP
jgi:hypothetical protein